jgi:hypothetical protein
LDDHERASTVDDKDASAIPATAPVFAAAGLEMWTGAGLIAAPSLLARLLFGSEMGGSGDLVGRIAGLVMLCLAVGCWPRASERGSRQALAPLLALSVLASLYLLIVGVGGANAGVLLWPAFAAHAILAGLLARVWISESAAERVTRRRRREKSGSGRREKRVLAGRVGLGAENEES